MRSQRIKLSNVPSLTFYADRVTVNGRRGPAVPQLACEGSACRREAPEVIQCTNMGGEGSDIDWRCEASLPYHLRLGRTTVSCEGWDGSSDPYVLKGSCGLSYSLISSQYREGTDRTEENGLAGLVFYFLFFGILGLIVYKFICGYQQPHHNGDHPPRPPFFGGGGGPDGGDAPPPYTQKPYTDYGTSRGQGYDVGYQPGFWAGAATGGFGAWLATRAFNSRNDHPTTNFNTRPTRDWNRGEGSSTASVRTSVGFGGTSNR